MLVLRLARTGRTKYPTYRIVAADSARAATGRFVASLGHYNPHTKELVIQREEAERYLGNGAQPSNSVIKLLLREGIELPKWAKLKTKEPKATEAPEAKVPVDEVPAQEGTTPEAAQEAPAGDAAEERVATVAEDAASDRADGAESMATQETAAGEEAQADAARDGEAASAAVAEDTQAEA